MSTLLTAQKMQVVIDIEEKKLEDGSSVFYATSEALPGMLVEAFSLEQMNEILGDIVQEHLNLTYNPGYREYILNRIDSQERVAKEQDEKRTMRALILWNIINQQNAYV